MMAMEKHETQKVGQKSERNATRAAAESNQEEERNAKRKGVQERKRDARPSASSILQPGEEWTATATNTQRRRVSTRSR